MSLESMMTDTVVIRYPVFVTDSRGNLIKDWTNATEVTTKAWITQRDTVELFGNREGTSSNWFCFLLKEIVLDNQCRIVYDAMTFEIVGKPHKAKTPEALHHIEVELKLVEG